MIHLAFSPLTKRFYYLPVKGKKVDITEDIKEIQANTETKIEQALKWCDEQESPELNSSIDRLRKILKD